MTCWRNISEFLALRRNTLLLFGALVLAGTGEMLWLGFAPKYIEVLSRKALIIREAKPELRARTCGAYYLVRDYTVTTGSLLGA